MTRFFAAVVPPDVERRRIEAFRVRWGSLVSPVEPHVTVKAPFVFEAGPGPLLDALGPACARVSPFSVALSGPGRFPGPGVLFLTVDSSALAHLHQTVVRALAPLLPEPATALHEGEHYHPHMTLAMGRFGATEAILDTMEGEANRELADLPPFSVRSLRLYAKATGDDRWQAVADLRLGS